MDADKWCCVRGEIICDVVDSDLTFGEVKIVVRLKYRTTTFVTK
jgi:hypothetical protein